MRKLKKLPEIPDARVGLCKKLGIDPKRIQEPRIKQLLDEYFEKARAILTEPIAPTPRDILWLAGREGTNVGACHVNNRQTRKG